VSEPVRVALQELLSEVIGVSGALVASIDGLLVAEATTGVEVDVVAALSAATSSVGVQFANVLGLGAATGMVIQASKGCAAVYPVGETAMLVLYCVDSTHVARLHLAVRQAMPRIGEAMGIPVS
jgi:predicted regulator of Ras-like GTPase activity (Roadblock/LC7/MglB family)